MIVFPISSPLLFPMKILIIMKCRWEHQKGSGVWKQISLLPKIGYFRLLVYRNVQNLDTFPPKLSLFII